MQGFSHIIKHRVDQLNGFIMVFYRISRAKEPALLTLRRRAVTIATTAFTSTVAIPLRPRRPTASGTAFLICGVFPVVKAWSPWKNKSEDAEDKKQLKSRPTISSLRLVDRKDKKLEKDINKADELFETGNTTSYDEAFNMLMLHLDKREPEVLWRLARLAWEKSKLAQTKDQKRLHVEKAYDLLFKAMTIDEQNFAVHKWMAIVMNELSSYNGLKAQLLESFNVKKHMLRATELNPDDPTCMYLLGHWCYAIADIPWYQRKLAETLFATPPECSFAEAYKHFLRAEYTQPGFYSMNLLMLAKCSIKAGDMEKAEQYLWQLKKFKVKTSDDYEAKQEGRQLREKLVKARKYGAT